MSCVTVGNWRYDTTSEFAIIPLLHSMRKPTLLHQHYGRIYLPPRNILQSDA